MLASSSARRRPSLGVTASTTSVRDTQKPAENPQDSSVKAPMLRPIRRAKLEASD